MKVFELMTIDAGLCRPDDNLTHAARIMWHRDCGIVPVVDPENKVLGVITDRDIAIAAATRDRSPSQIRAAEMPLRDPVACRPTDDLKDVLKKMRKFQVKRVIVTDEKGQLVGIVSLSDILTKASDKKSARKTLLKTIKAVFSPAPIVLTGEEADDEADETDEFENEETETDETDGRE